MESLLRGEEGFVFLSRRHICLRMSCRVQLDTRVCAFLYRRKFRILTIFYMQIILIANRLIYYYVVFAQIKNCGARERAVAR
jgi:hypothetical protein